MMRKMLFALLVGVVFTSGLVFAEQSNKIDSRNTRGGFIEMQRSDEAWSVKNDELHQFDVTSPPRFTPGFKVFQYDTLLYFTAERGDTNGWVDKVTSTPWDTVDFTKPANWHVDDFLPCSGESAWWCGDKSIPGTYNGGYDDGWYMTLTTPVIQLTDGDSCFLVYEQWLRCEENYAFPRMYSWDGYNVRIDTSDFSHGDSLFFEIKPYQVPADTVEGSYYRGKFYHEWDRLRNWERHGEPEMGGFSDTTQTGCSVRLYDLRPFAGDSVKLRYVFATDWEYATWEQPSLLGLVLDDILVVDDMDSAKLDSVRHGTLLGDLGGDSLFFEDAEDYPYQMVPYVKPAAGSWWWLAMAPDARNGDYKADDGDKGTGRYAQDIDNGLISPKIVHSLLDTNMANMYLDWYFKCYVDPDSANAYNMFRISKAPTPIYQGAWKQISVLTEPNGESYVYGLDGVTDATWWSCDQWSDWMHCLTPLVLDTNTWKWDTLQVCVGFQTSAPQDTTFAGCRALQVDDVTLSGYVAPEFDVGVSGAKIPSPNANDVELYMDTVTVTNYGWNQATSGTYAVWMCIEDSMNNQVFGPQTISAFPPPTVPYLSSRKVVLDTTAAGEPNVKFTLKEEGLYDFYIWTVWPGDLAEWNDTLVTEYEATSKQLLRHYPYTFNYPAGQGQLRYHDLGFYMYPMLNIFQMEAGDIAAVRFEPDPSFYPLDCRLVLPDLYNYGGNYNLKVYELSGNPDIPGTELASIAFSDSNDNELHTVRIEVDTVDVLQDMDTGFWLGIEFPTGTGDAYVMGCEASDQDKLPIPDSIFTDYVLWQHSYIETSGVWSPWDRGDWMLTLVYSWQLISDISATASPADTTGSETGDLYLDWEPDSVSQAKFLVYRSTDIDSPFSLHDSTKVSNYLDLNVCGDVDTSYYYLFRTWHCAPGDSGVYEKVHYGAVGEHDRKMAR